MSTVQQAKIDKYELKAQIVKLISEYQQKHPGLIIEGISIITTSVDGYPPVQTVESKVKIN